MHTTLETILDNKKCPRCKQKLENTWESSFHQNTHYLTTSCQHCAYDIFYKADFLSNGIHL